MIDVLCFGEILWDLFEVKPDTYVREPGGAPANVATALGLLGLEVAILGAVGRDGFGDERLARLEAAGVDTRYVARLPERTGITFVTRDARGEPRFLHYRRGSADLALSAEHVKPVKARWLVMSTGSFVTPELAGASEVALARAKNVFVDLNARPHMWTDRRALVAAAKRLIARATIVKGSEADFDAIGFIPRGKPVIVTRGEGPATVLDVKVPARKARCVDATGGGDAFTAGALAVHIAGGDWTKALRVGHILGAKAVSRVGAVRGLTGLEKVRWQTPSTRPRG